MTDSDDLFVTGDTTTTAPYDQALIIGHWSLVTSDELLPEGVLPAGEDVYAQAHYEACDEGEQHGEVAVQAVVMIAYQPGAEAHLYTHNTYI